MLPLGFRHALLKSHTTQFLFFPTFWIFTSLLTLLKIYSEPFSWKIGIFSPTSKMYVNVFGKVNDGNGMRPRTRMAYWFSEIWKEFRMKICQYTLSYYIIFRQWVYIYLACGHSWPCLGATFNSVLRLFLAVLRVQH